LEHPERVTVEGRPFPKQVEVAGQLHRAIVSHADSSIDFELRELRDGEVVGSFALLSRGAASSAPARFRGLVRDGAEVVTLFDERIAPGETRPFRSALPPDLGEAAVLRLEVAYEESGRGPAPLAAWLEPVVRKTTARGRQAPVDRPNIVLITSDTTRQDDLWLYGGPVRTPALEALAAKGFLLTNAHSVAYGTTPSHSSLMTSLPAVSHGVYNNRSVLGPGEPTLAEVLREAGYDTAAFVSARPLARSLGLDRGFDLYDDVFAEEERSGLGFYSRHERRADATVDQMLGWLDRRGESPFFVWLHLFDAHQPYSPPPGWADPYLENGSLGEVSDGVRALASQAGAPRYLKPSEIVDEAPEFLSMLGPLARGLYRGEIAFLAAQVARVIEALARRGIDDQSLVVFVSDHGENFLERGAHLAFEHTGLHREVTRLPLLFRPPGARELGTRHDLLATNTDVAPTIADFAEVEAPSSWAGVSLRPALESGAGTAGAGSSRDMAAEAAPGHDHVILEGAHRQEVAVRTPRWLYREVLEPHRSRHGTLHYLGYQPEVPFELYDLSDDPAETRNLYHEDHPELARLRGMIREHLASERRAADPLASPEHRKALEALGYVE
jgi:arylsulfatase A-like enzyme